MTTVKPILLAEDNPRDAELALAAMEEHHIADKVVVCHDGAEVLDYLYCRGLFKSRECGNPVVVFLDLKMPKIDSGGDADLIPRRTRFSSELRARRECLCGQTRRVSTVHLGRERARRVLGGHQRTAARGN